jgi:undecaprenyl diphosphate synthase
MSQSTIPKHIGFIVDGNRRWAKQHGIPTYEGHLAGYNTLREIGLEALAMGVEYMSAYVFSTENWSRSEDEVGKLMGLILRILKSDLPIFHEKNIKIRVLGSRDRLEPKIIKAIESAEAKTANNTGGVLALCLNYGGQQEIVDAVKKIVQSGVNADDIDKDTIEQNLYAPEVPPVDILVRTSGEKRISNFMLWRIAYSEMHFIDKMWPEMTKKDLKDIIKEYKKRFRRFGG